MQKWLALPLLALSSGVAQADWLNFRGPNATGVAEVGSLPPTTLSDDALSWKVSLPGRGLSSPIVVGDQVIVTAASGPDQSALHVFSFAMTDGELQWHRQFWATGRTMSHQKTNVAAPTPASDGQRIYALYSSNDLFCLDLDGNLIWTRGLTVDYPNASNSLGLASSPMVAGETLVVQIENDSESFAAGLDLSTGENKWKLDRPKAANWTSPILVEDGETLVVALQSSKGVLGVLPETGSEVWNFKKGASTTPSSVARGGRLYIPSNGLTAIEPGDNGAEIEPLWVENAQRPGTASPLVIGDEVYIINNAGVLNAANADTGERLWRVRLKAPISGSPVASGTHGYVVSEQGILQCVDLSKGEAGVPSEYDLGETVLCTPSISDGRLFVRSDGSLWCFHCAAVEAI